MIIDPRSAIKTEKREAEKGWEEKTKTTLQDKSKFLTQEYPLGFVRKDELSFSTPKRGVNCCFIKMIAFEILFANTISL